MKSSTKNSTTETNLSTSSTKDSKTIHLHLIVASDALARGIDLLNVNQVINYDLPMRLETYVHRVGRTARASRSCETWAFSRRRRLRRPLQPVDE